MRDDRKFEVGEEVIVSRPEACIWGCTPEMRHRKGTIATIRRVRWLESPKRWEYTIVGDIFHFSWSEECFDPVRKVCELPGFTPAEEDALQSLLM